MKITTKTSINFSFAKLARFVGTKKYLELKSKATFEPMVDEYKKFIKAGKVTPELHKKTRYNRMKKASQGGVKPLFYTGKLVDSLRYSSKKQAVYGVDYAAIHKNGNPSRNLPERNFITQTHEALGEKGELKAQSRGTKQLVMEMRKRFRRKLAK